MPNISSLCELSNFKTGAKLRQGNDFYTKCTGSGECVVGVNLSEPHIYVISINFVCLSVFLSVGPYVHNMIIYKC